MDAAGADAGPRGERARAALRPRRRAQVRRLPDRAVVRPVGRVVLCSRRGADLAAAFPEIRQAALAELPTGARLDGELVVWENDRLAFERLQARAAARGARAEAASREWRTRIAAFDLLHLGRDALTCWPYARRRAGLGDLLAGQGLTAPLTLCPSTTDTATARGWPQRAAVGVEGLVFTRLADTGTSGYWYVRNGDLADRLRYPRGPGTAGGTAGLVDAPLRSAGRRVRRPHPTGPSRGGGCRGRWF
ncbi:hypothetical protein [Kitasatospora sp. DSM 101779]|uniref:ATP-dependent DNA ligase n=1 Tax=Kitasatospora sp. DSM 101779 TaxID=2853165 RepID=UPI0037ED3749|nr:hypothetical protein [Kitasatospora sp. DSM 101779]